METVCHVLEVLTSNNYLALSTALNVTSVCKIFHGVLSEVYWKRTLQRHFPSFYLIHLSDYNKSTDVCWKDEYKKAYLSFGLRYMDGANLQQSKVMHFGPTLDEDTIDAINNHDEGFHLPSNTLDNDLGVCYEGNFFISDESLTLIDTASAMGEEAPLHTHEGIVFANRFYITEDLAIERPPYHFLVCYDIESKNRMWQREINCHYDGIFPTIAFDNKVFLVSGNNLMCFDYADGEELFRIKCECTGKKYQQIGNTPDDEDEVSPWNTQLAIEGDFAVWIAEHYDQKFVVVANWKERELHGTFDLSASGDEALVLSRFAVSNGILYVNLCYDPMDVGELICVAIDLSLTSKESGITELWRYKSPGSWEEHSDVGPCVYRDIVLDMFLCVDGEDAWIVALVASSGAVIWRRKLHIRRESSGSIIPVHFFVIEGTASIEERQNQRQKRLAESAEHKESNAEVCEEDDDRYGDRVTKEAEPTKKSKNTKFPTLRFAIRSTDEDYMLFEGAAIVETGELLYFNEHELESAPYAVVAISKHQKPQYLNIRA